MTTVLRFGLVPAQPVVQGSSTLRPVAQTLPRPRPRRQPQPVVIVQTRGTVEPMTFADRMNRASRVEREFVHRSQSKRVSLRRLQRARSEGELARSFG